VQQNKNNNKTDESANEHIIDRNMCISTAQCRTKTNTIKGYDDKEHYNQTSKHKTDDKGQEW